MGRLQHFGYFFSRGFGPQGWGRDYQAWNDDWTRPDLYAHAVRDLERAGFDLVVVEDAVSLGNPATLDLRVRAAYGGPKHDPLLLAPYLFAATTHLGVVPTVNAGITPPYLAARQAATLQHLSGDRFGLNLVTDVGSARHVGREPVAHDVAYDRAEEWIDVVRRLWHSWDDGALVADPVTGRFADGGRIDAFQHRGEHFTLDGPLNALPCAGENPCWSPPGDHRADWRSRGPVRTSSSPWPPSTPRRSAPTVPASSTPPRRRGARPTTSGCCSSSNPNW